MYQDYFGLNRKPFDVTPDPRFIFLSAKHKEALAHLVYGIEHGSGFVELSGEVGAGKTTLLRTLLRECDTDDYRTAFIFNPRLSALDLLRTIDREFGLDSEGARSELFDRLNRFLLEQNAAGRTVLIVVDEAQNLKTTALEEIRLLSNLETETDKLVQIILVGQPELRRLLGQTEIRQLNQRIAVRYHLEPLDAEETRRYVRHRLQVAGAGEEEIFSNAALKRIHRWSAGVPRRINMLCDRILLSCYGEDRRRVNGADVARACRELQPERRFFNRSFAGRLAVILGIFAVFLVLTRLTPLIRQERTMPMREATGRASVTAEKPPSADRTKALRAALSRMSETQTLNKALAALSDIWDEPVTAATLEGGNSRELMERFALPMANFRGGFSQLLRLDAPSLVELTLPGVAGSRYLAVVGKRDGRVFVEPKPAGKASIDIRQFERLWCGKAYVPWRNPEKIPFLARAGREGEGVAALQRQLRACGLYGGKISGRYDTATIEAVTQLQTGAGIAPDGRVGPQTLMILYRTAGGHHRPALSAASGEQP